MSIKKRFLSALLAVVLALGIVTPALAYHTSDFSDMPESHWAYDSVMRMADAGVIEGVGNGRFDPNSKVTASMFLTLVGRAVFTEEALAQLSDRYFEVLDISRDSWYGPYMVAAWCAGITLLSDLSPTDLDAEVTRNQMAVVLKRAIVDKNSDYDLGLGLGEKEVDTTEITDYAAIPDEYKDYVAQTYAYGLIQGDENGNFNGGDTMTRAEVAVVMDRLMEQLPAFKEAQAKKEAAEEAERQALKEAYDPNSIELTEGKYLRIDRGFQAGNTMKLGFYQMKVGETVRITVNMVPEGFYSVKYGYTRADVEWTSADESIATVVLNDDGTATVTAVGEGVVAIEARIPEIYSPSVVDPTGFNWTTTSDSVHFKVMP